MRHRSRSLACLLFGVLVLGCAGGQVRDEDGLELRRKLVGFWHAERDAGSWKAFEDLELGADGTFVLRDEQEGEDDALAGSWRIEGSRVLLAGRSKDEVHVVCILVTRSDASSFEGVWEGLGGDPADPDNAMTVLETDCLANLGPGSSHRIVASRAER